MATFFQINNGYFNVTDVKMKIAGSQFSYSHHFITVLLFFINSEISCRHLQYSYFHQLFNFKSFMEEHNVWLLK